MTGTQVHEALRSVADATTAPPVDRLTFQRLVRQERRRRYAGRAGVAAGVAACVAVAAAALAPFFRDEAAPDVTPGTPVAGSIDLDHPVYLAVDGELTALDPEGRTYDLGIRAQEVIGYTSEFVYVVGPGSGLVRFDAHHGDEGPQDPWTFERVDSGVDGPLQSAQLSADGRYLGWIDLGEDLHQRDLLAGTTADPVETAGSAYLVDIAQGSGVALVSDDRGLVRYTPQGERVVPVSTWDATASRDLVAVPQERSTLVYRLLDDGTGGLRAVGEVPGTGRLSPYGDWVASVANDPDDMSSTVWLAVPGQEAVRLDIAGRPYQLAWADDDTLLVTATVGQQEALFGCEAASPHEPCVRLDVDAASRYDLSR